MSHESDASRTVSVSDDDVRVEKSFARDEFPVPAIRFRLESAADEPVHVRIVDRIPEDFPMEGIGFHPDYESDNWTAYKDHRVEYERTLAPNESVTTVYGIRLDEGSDVEGFLGDPILERPPAPGEPSEDRPGVDVDDVLGADRSQLVRDALQGRGRLAEQSPEPAETGDTAGDVDAGAGDPGPTDADADAETPAPREFDAGLSAAIRRNADAVAPVTEPDGPRALESSLSAAVRRDEEAVTPVAAGSAEESKVESEAESGATAEDDGAVAGDTEADDGRASGSAAVATDGADGGFAAALAAEIRAGEVSESDLETLRGELDGGLPRSADVRIRRLQSQLAELDAYTDALEEFIDEEGTGTELVERLDAELDDVTTELDALREGAEAADAEREALRDDLEDLSGDLDATDERLEDVDATAATAVAGVEELHERADGIGGQLDDLESDLDDVDEAVEGVAADVDGLAADLDETDAYVSEVDDELQAVSEDVAAVDDEVAAVRDDLENEVDDLQAEVASLTDELDRVDDVEAEIQQLQAFRDRLNSAFGPGGSGGGNGEPE